LVTGRCYTMWVKVASHSERDRDKLVLPWFAEAFQRRVGGVGRRSQGFKLRDERERGMGKNRGWWERLFKGQIHEGGIPERWGTFGSWKESTIIAGSRQQADLSERESGRMGGEGRDIILAKGRTLKEVT